jgi:hypothetical protein
VRWIAKSQGAPGNIDPNKNNQGLDTPTPLNNINSGGEIREQHQHQAIANTAFPINH